MMHFTPSHRLMSRLVPQVDAAVTAASQPIPVFVAVKRRSGLRHYARCVFRGCYDPEVARGRPIIWTADQAAVECHFAGPTKLQFIWVEIGSTAPQGAHVSLSVDDEPIVQQKRVRRRGTICVKLPERRVVTSLVLGIESTTFVPGNVMSESDDNRPLGVGLRAIVFGKRKTKYRAGSYGHLGLNQRVARVLGNWWARKAA
jgi:hypothetical protein